MFHARYILRLSVRGTFRRTCATAQNEAKPLREKEKGDPQARYIALLERYENKIKFNSKLEALKIKYGPMKLHVMKAREVKEQRQIKYGFKKMHITQAREVKEQRRKEYEDKKLPPLPIALRYVVDKERLLKDPEDMEEDIEEEEPVAVYLPYSKVAEIQYTEDQEKPKSKKFDKSNIDNWMTNYSHFDDTKIVRRANADEESDDEEEDWEWTKRYGTPDPNERISRVQCGGCGAFLHCTNTSMPGYVPSEILKHRTEDEMKAIECQRCHFLKHYNIALNVNVHPDEYQNLLLQIANRRALVILMVDLLDFPCSIWPGIVDVIGTQRPLLIVGNKVDLLPDDGAGYLKRVRESLVNEIRMSPLKQANIKAVSLISAKTGYGVEDLISNLFKNWLYKGDVFLIGCTNVGKSSLFNKLLQSDYCKVHAVDIIHRATVSPWPGTTLNLLKFPINRPSAYKIYTRTKRLKLEAHYSLAEAELQESKSVNSSNLPSLISHIGRSFVDESRVQSESDPFAFGGPPDSLTSQYVPQSGIDESREVFKRSRWFYDTPGVVHPDQILPFLTADELLLVLPKSPIVPRSYYVVPGTALFIGGVARLDVVDGPRFIRVTVFASKDLPITTTKIEDADEVYEKFLGTEFFSVPVGGEKRLSQWPGLTRHNQLITLMGQGRRKSCADVILSSVGWISLTGEANRIIEVEAWTPEARGVHVRKPSMLEQAVTLRGRRIAGSPAYNIAPRKIYF